MELETLFDDVDDFCLIFEPSFNRQILSSKQKKRIKNSRLSLSEIMTIIIYFHQNIKLITPFKKKMNNKLF